MPKVREEVRKSEFFLRKASLKGKSSKGKLDTQDVVFKMLYRNLKSQEVKDKNGVQGQDNFQNMISFSELLH